MRDIYIYIIDLEAEFYFQSGVSTRIASCSPECLHILKYLASHRPAGTSKYIHTAVLVSICGNAECTEARTRGRHRKTGHRTFPSSTFASLLLVPPLSRLYFTFMRRRAPGSSGVSSIALNVLSTPLISPRHSRFSLMRRLCTRCTRITLNVAQQWHTCGQRIIAGILLCCVCV